MELIGKDPIGGNWILLVGVPSAHLGAKEVTEVRFFAASVVKFAREQVRGAVVSKIME